MNVANRLLLGRFKLKAGSFVESLEADDLIDSGRVSFVSSTTQKIVGTRNKCSDALFPFIDLVDLME